MLSPNNSYHCWSISASLHRTFRLSGTILFLLVPFMTQNINTAKLARTLYSLVTGEAVAKLSSNHTATVAVYPILIFNLLVITIYAQLEGTAD
jgi:hypothetical protein